MRITHVDMQREDVLVALGPHWPAAPGAVVTRIGALGIEHGAVAVHDTDDQPGTTWWTVDGLIVPQDAGPAPVLPGCPQETAPEPSAESPPPTPVLAPPAS
ncbi:hypothetical protein [Streptomyces sp. NBC_00582]|uniref:hypothetical protein n=1 Tax=Streptomyces sp. NBC_00582 TaxID=2975783 RepID=UPI002E802E54|nr:hypothetical protein [Streptomyces sp. NBC_00582]WUB63886.1 hypothetical protein OG852_27570 [Streptomyces sp. NBC_00582]